MAKTDNKADVRVVPIDLDQMCERPREEPCLHCLLKALALDYAKRSSAEPSDIIADVTLLLIQMLAACPVKPQRQGLVDAIVKSLPSVVEEIHAKGEAQDKGQVH